MLSRASFRIVSASRAVLPSRLNVVARPAAARSQMAMQSTGTAGSGMSTQDQNLNNPIVDQAMGVSDPNIGSSFSSDASSSSNLGANAGSSEAGQGSQAGFGERIKEMASVSKEHVKAAMKNQKQVRAARRLWCRQRRFRGLWPLPAAASHSRLHTSYLRTLSRHWHLR